MCKCNVLATYEQMYITIHRNQTVLMAQHIRCAMPSFSRVSVNTTVVGSLGGYSSRNSRNIKSPRFIKLTYFNKCNISSIKIFLLYKSYLLYSIIDYNSY